VARDSSRNENCLKRPLIPSTDLGKYADRFPVGALEIGVSTSPGPRVPAGDINDVEIIFFDEPVENVLR